VEEDHRFTLADVDVADLGAIDQHAFAMVPVSWENTH
jgi:hypothetical protein